MSTSRWRWMLPWLLLLTTGLAVAWIRYGFIESASATLRCDAISVPWWCELRRALVLGFLYYVYGVAALIATAWAFMGRRPWVAWLAAALGVTSLLLYCILAGALAFLLGCLRLLRLQASARTAPYQHDRQRDRQVHAQP